MLRTAVIFAATAVLALAACSDSKVETATADKSVKIEIDGDSAATTSVNVEADSETGKVEISLPGGIEAKITAPETLGDGSKFDVEGVGLYPGARVTSLKVNAAQALKTNSATVQIGFSAPADAAAVADWYQAQFEAKGVTISRTGDTLSGSGDDADAFTIALQSAGAGKSQGLTTITDRKKG